MRGKLKHARARFNILLPTFLQESAGFASLNPARMPQSCMTNGFPLLLAALVWFAVSAPTAAGPSPDTAASPAPATARTEAGVVENAVADAPSTCEYGCEDHREGTEICINKKQHRCGKQGWHPTGLTCADPPPVTK